MGLLTGNLNVPGILYMNYIEDIIRWREDMNFIFEWQNNIFERAQRVSKILFLQRQNKIHIFKPPCNVLFIIQTKRHRQNNTFLFAKK